MVSAKTTERQTENNDQQDPMLVRTSLVKPNFASPSPYCAISNLNTTVREKSQVQELNAVLLTDFLQYVTIFVYIITHHYQQFKRFSSRQDGGFRK